MYQRTNESILNHLPQLLSMYAVVYTEQQWTVERYEAKARHNISA